MQHGSPLGLIQTVCTGLATPLPQCHVHTHTSAHTLTNSSRRTHLTSQLCLRAEHPRCIQAMFSGAENWLNSRQACGSPSSRTSLGSLMAARSAKGETKNDNDGEHVHRIEEGDRQRTHEQTEGREKDNEEKNA